MHKLPQTEYKTINLIEQNFVAPVFEKGYPCYEAVNRQTIIAQEYSGMEMVGDFSEPLIDLDFNSEGPDPIII